MSVNESDVDDKELHDKHACAELIQAWGLYRDQGKWPELLATFAPDGQIAVSWFSGSFREFVDRCRSSFDAGQRSKHHIFPSIVRVAGERAVAETNIVILVRQKIGGVLADMTSYARFLDRLERTERAGAGPSSSAPPSTSATGSIRSSRRRRSAGCSRRPTSRSIRSPTATWPRVSSPPAARSRRWSTRRLAAHGATVRALRRLAGAARVGRPAAKSLSCNRRRQRRGPGVVTVEPIGIGLVAHPGVGARSRSAPPTRAACASLRRAGTRPRRRRCSVDAAREHRRVLERHGGARRHVRRHRMAGIAEQARCGPCARWQADRARRCPTCRPRRRVPAPPGRRDGNPRKPRASRRGRLSPTRIPW